MSKWTLDDICAFIHKQKAEQYGALHVMTITELCVCVLAALCEGENTDGFVQCSV